MQLLQLSLARRAPLLLQLETIQPLAQLQTLALLPLGASVRLPVPRLQTRALRLSGGALRHGGG